MSAEVAAWERRGRHVELAGDDVFVVDVPGPSPTAPTMLVLHGFPTCSFDWRHVVPRLAASSRVVLFDFPGFGLSAKPDRRYSLFAQADVAAACAQQLDLRDVVLVTHDMGDSVGGELLARDLDGDLPFGVTRRVVANGSIYMDLVALSEGQRLLLALPDERLDRTEAPDGELFRAGVGATFAPDTPASDDELDAQWELMRRDDGHCVVTRTIRYIEERRVHEKRWTGAIERHPAPLTVVWGDADPIARFAMAERLVQRRPDAVRHRLAGIGHYPMIEAPDAFADAVLDNR